MLKTTLLGRKIIATRDDIRITISRRLPLSWSSIASAGVGARPAFPGRSNISMTFYKRLQ